VVIQLPPTHKHGTKVHEKDDSQPDCSGITESGLVDCGRIPGALERISYMGVKMLQELTPLLTAIISATALLISYVYLKQKEQGAETRKTRQDVYSRLISNITKRNELLGHLQLSPEWKKTQNHHEQDQLVLNDLELSRNEGNRTEVVALLCLYGTDDAVEAYARWARENINADEQGGNLGALVLALRKSIYPGTLTTADQANLAIWFDSKYLKKSLMVR
jgi:hypothetical protein